MRTLPASIFILAFLLLTACGPAAAPTSPAPSTVAPAQSETPTLESTESPSPSMGPSFEPFVAQFTPEPTETALPTLELPSPLPAGPTILQVWDGLPTYLADSKPNFEFRLRFDPALWALTKNDFGFPAILNRLIPVCSISPSTGHGLPPNLTVEHDTRKLGGVNYQINTAFLNGIRQFVTYSGGDGVVFTSFEVTFQDQVDQCLNDAETVLSTFTSVPISQATPAPTP